jgi:hypothetical protein
MAQAKKHPLIVAVERATSDDDFRARLLADARSTLEKEMGLAFPEGTTLNVVENTATETTIVLPLRDEDLDLESLTVGETTASAWCYHVNWLRTPGQLDPRGR